VTSTDVGVTDVVLTVDDAPIPRVTWDPLAPKFSVTQPLPTNPLIRSVKVTLILVNAIGLSYKATVYADYIFPPPRIDPTVLTISQNPTIKRFTWAAPVAGPPVLGYTVYIDGVKDGETSTVPGYVFYNFQPNPDPLAPLRQFEVRGLFSLPEYIYTSSAATIML
jgi:hypothetical protein